RCARSNSRSACCPPHLCILKSKGATGGQIALRCRLFRRVDDTVGLEVVARRGQANRASRSVQGHSLHFGSVSMSGLLPTTTEWRTSKTVETCQKQTLTGMRIGELLIGLGQYRRTR